jgi:hypothetical protein
LSVARVAREARSRRGTGSKSEDGARGTRSKNEDGAPRQLGLRRGVVLRRTSDAHEGVGEGQPAQSATPRLGGTLLRRRPELSPPRSCPCAPAARVPIARPSGFEPETFGSVDGAGFPVDSGAVGRDRVRAAIRPVSGRFVSGGLPWLLFPPCSPPNRGPGMLYFLRVTVSRRRSPRSLGSAPAGITRTLEYPSGPGDREAAHLGGGGVQLAVVDVDAEEPAAARRVRQLARGSEPGSWPLPRASELGQARGAVTVLDPRRLHALSGKQRDRQLEPTGHHRPRLSEVVLVRELDRAERRSHRAEPLRPPIRTTVRLLLGWSPPSGTHPRLGSSAPTSG